MTKGVCGADITFMMSIILALTKLRTHFKSIINSNEKMKFATEHAKLCSELLSHFHSRVKIAKVASYPYNVICCLMSPLVHLYTSSIQFKSFKTRQEQVMSFLQADSVSTQLPGAKHTGIYYLNNSLCATHKKFHRETGSKIGFSLFCRFRQKSVVKLIHEIPARMSVCQECENVRLKANSLKAAGVIGCPSNVVEGLRKVWCLGEEATLPPLKCAKMNCLSCKCKHLMLEKDLFKNAMTNEVSARAVVYHEWTNVPHVDNKDAFHVQQVQKTLSLRHFISLFLDLIVSLSTHMFIATWQWMQYRDIKKIFSWGLLLPYMILHKTI